MLVISRQMLVFSSQMLAVSRQMLVVSLQMLVVSIQMLVVSRQMLVVSRQMLGSRDIVFVMTVRSLWSRQRSDISVILATSGPAVEDNSLRLFGYWWF